MNDTIRKNYSRGFYIILALFTFIYLIGALFMLLSWLGIQGYDPQTWQPNAIPLYVLVFLMGCIGLYGIWNHKKWGVYGLVGAWTFTGIINLGLVSPTTIPYKTTFLALLLVISFFLLLLPEWHHMD